MLPDADSVTAAFSFSLPAILAFTCTHEPIQQYRRPTTCSEQPSFPLFSSSLMLSPDFNRIRGPCPVVCNLSPISTQIRIQTDGSLEASSRLSFIFFLVQRRRRPYHRAAVLRVEICTPSARLLGPQRLHRRNCSVRFARRKTLFPSQQSSPQLSHDICGTRTSTKGCTYNAHLAPVQVDRGQNTIYFKKIFSSYNQNWVEAPVFSIRICKIVS